MAKVFISHAHTDKALARQIMALLSGALDLTRTDFFSSSREGRGVAPGMQIREELLEQLSAADTLIVLVTPLSAGSPWVWLEAGFRLASGQKRNPVFVVPSEKFTALLKPVADLKALHLNNENELHELVNEIATSLNKTPQDALSYNEELKDLAHAANHYSVSRARVTAWLKANATLLVLFVVITVGAAFGFSLRQSAEDTLDIENWNNETLENIRQYMVLKGRVVSGENISVDAATITASLQDDLRDPASCTEPACTVVTTTTDGRFRIDLTKIQARHGSDVFLSVMKPGFAGDSRWIHIDVRAMHADDPAETVVLRSLPQ